MPDLLTLAGLASVLFWALATAVMYLYAGRHYTRLPGGSWTTWENAQSPHIEPKEDQAA